MANPHSKINFPLYCVSPLSSGYFIAGGGGGSASTGVHNGFVIFETAYDKTGYIASEVLRHNTGSSAVMNCAVGNYNNGKKYYVAVGKDSDCFVYQVKVQPLGSPPEPNANEAPVRNDGHGLRNRGTSNGAVPGMNRNLEDAEREQNNFSVDDLVFHVETICNGQTDFAAVDPCQNAVVFSHDARLIVTGGVDGILRVWNIPEMQERLKIEASKKEIADLDISSDRKLVSCVSRDGKCKIWSIVDGRLKVSLDLPPEDDGKYLYKRSRFGFVEEKTFSNRLFVILNPTNSKNKSYIQHWTGPDFTLTKVCPVGEPLSALAVSRCGRYVAVGSMTTGDVDIYIGFSLQRLKHVEKAHKNFVTGLTFLPPALHTRAASLEESDVVCVSISIDNQILLHHIEHKRGISVWVAMILLVAVLFLTYTGCSYLGL